MCGVIGFTFNNEKLLSSGLDAISHRGPDARGKYSDPGISLGHCRLSIIDLSASSNQPFKSEKGDVTISFNGEIYNYRDIKKNLESAGHRFRTSGDTEVILEGYKKDGIKIFDQLRGMWALAIYDKIKKKIILSRDIFGIKPLYYAVVGGKLYFSSELKGLLKVIPQVEPNTATYYQFFNLGYFCAPDTCYADVKKLMPGEMLEWDMKEKKIILLTSIAPDIKPENKDITFEEAVDMVDRALRDSVEAHFVSDVPVGLLLSGGNDSSLLAAIAKSLGKNPKMYHLAVKNSTDTYYAREVAKHLGLEIESIAMDSNALERQYDRIWDMLDEPTGDISVIPASLIYSHVKGKTKVVLSGEGGDEFFGGYVRHRNLLAASKVREHSQVLALLDRLGSGASPMSISAINPLVRRARNFLLDSGMVNDLIGAYLKSVKLVDFPYDQGNICRYLLSFFHESKQHAWTQPALFFDLWLYLPNNLMYKNDISSMASSIEARVPFLDRVFMETVLKNINPRFLLSSQYQSKALLKKVMERYLPPHLIYRDKKGFGFSPSAYTFGKMKADFYEALRFHRGHADQFGIPAHARGLFDERKADLLFRKYSRFAFALISNWKVWGGKLTLL